MNTTAIKILADKLNFPEGPAFAPDGSLWAVELKGGSLVRYKDRLLERVPVGGKPNGIAIDGQGMIWYCDAGQHSIRCLDAVTKKIQIIADEVEGEPLDEPNDLAFDRTGNLVFTCPGNSRKEPTGYACVLLKDGPVKKITTGKYFPNGLAFTADGRQLIIAETYRHRLWKGDWDGLTGEWTNARIWCDIGGPDGPGGPDGMAFDGVGDLYVAVFGTGEIRVVDPSGKVKGQIPLPGRNPTNCAFAPSERAGQDELGLVVTEAENGMLLNLPITYHS